jgi:hypothetical protein
LPESRAIALPDNPFRSLAAFSISAMVRLREFMAEENRQSA